MNNAAIQKRIDDMFQRVERMTDAELMMLRTIWDEQDSGAREDAWQSVKAIIRSRKRTPMLEDARARLAAWVNNYFTAPELGFFWAARGSGMDQGTIRKAVLPPVLDAVAATIAADALDAREQALLLEPISRLSRHSQ
jgi:hypothetical protein